MRCAIAAVSLWFLLAPTATASVTPTIRITAVASRLVVQFPPDGRVGNVERIRWSLRDRYGRLIGKALIQCHWQRPFERLCAGSLAMPLGQITTAGTSQTRAVGIWAVTGGTGVYKGASGELRFVATSFDKFTVIITF